MKISAMGRIILCLLLLTCNVYTALAIDPAIAYETEPPEFGHKIKVTYRPNASSGNSKLGRKKSIKGELLAISDELIYLGNKRIRVSQNLSQPPRQNASQPQNSFYENFYKIPIEEIIYIQMERHDTSGWNIVMMTCGGVILSISNGWFLMITVPLWLLTGLFAAVSTARSNHIEFEQAEWSDLSNYARFPQGIPDEIKEIAVLP